jgi:hypothetical protein
VQRQKGRQGCLFRVGRWLGRVGLEGWQGLSKNDLVRGQGLCLDGGGVADRWGLCIGLCLGRGRVADRPRLSRRGLAGRSGLSGRGLSSESELS